MHRLPSQISLSAIEISDKVVNATPPGSPLHPYAKVLTPTSRDYCRIKDTDI